MIGPLKREEELTVELEEDINHLLSRVNYEGYVYIDHRDVGIKTLNIIKTICNENNSGKFFNWVSLQERNDVIDVLKLIQED